MVNVKKHSPVHFRSLSFRAAAFLAVLSLIVAGLTSCGSGSSSGRDSATAEGGADNANFNCDGSCPSQQLLAADVERIVRQAVATAQSLGVNATISVVDRVGNVLALFQMNGAPAMAVINGQIGAAGGLEGLAVPSVIAVISKAGTGAYLSSQGNAFTTRTASQIVQEHFDPLEDQAPGGPLFGVQFSSLICSDVTVLNPSLSGGIPFGAKPASGGLTGPRPLPLGLSADPGGLPLYKQGDVVGGVGVEFDGAYTLDRNISDVDKNPEEIVALGATIGFEAPSERTGNNNFVGGKSLRFTDASFADVPAFPQTLPTLETTGTLVPLTFYSDGTIRDGSVFGTPGSGFANTVRAGVPASVLVDGAGNVRFPTRGGSLLSASEVDAILDSAMLTANRARAAIRRPLDSSARVSIWVVDTDGAPLGFTRGQDAPIFGTDVSLQKGRSAVFFSSPDANARLNEVRARNGVGDFNDYVSATEQFIPGAFSNGIAYSARGIGNLARPFYTDGIDGNPNGPLSLPFPLAGGARTWSPFNDGLQLDLVFQRLAQPLGIPANPPPSVPSSCVDERLGNRLRNGIQIFAGGVPLYRNGVLAGGIGISGDGIDQDDMIAFLGASRKGLDFAGHTDIGDPELGFNAPKEIRCDTVEPVIFPGTRLRYVNCPEAPFIGSSEQNQCDAQ